VSYRVTASDPAVSIDDRVGEVQAATRAKAAGVTTQAQLDTLIATVTTANNSGMSATACALLQVLASIIRIDP